MSPSNSCLRNLSLKLAPCGCPLKYPQTSRFEAGNPNLLKKLRFQRTKRKSERFRESSLLRKKHAMSVDHQPALALGSIDLRFACLAERGFERGVIMESLKFHHNTHLATTKFKVPSTMTSQSFFCRSDG